MSILVFPVLATLVVVPAAAGRPADGAGSAKAAVSFPSGVAFGKAAAGSESLGSVTFSNTRRVAVTVGPLGIVADGPAAFGMAGDDCGAEVFELQPGESCTYVIRFTPSADPEDKPVHYRAWLVGATSAGEVRIRLTGMAERG